MVFTGALTNDRHGGRLQYRRSRVPHANINFAPASNQTSTSRQSDVRRRQTNRLYVIPKSSITHH